MKERGFVVLLVLLALGFAGCSSDDTDGDQGPGAGASVPTGGVAPITGDPTGGSTAPPPTGGTGGQPVPPRPPPGPTPPGPTAGGGGAAGQPQPPPGTAGGSAGTDGPIAGQDEPPPVVDPDAAVPEADAGPADTDTGVDPDVGTDPLPPLPVEQTLPIVFVHGFAGSAEQYQSQAMRFVANGYPQERIRGFDHDGAGMDMAGYANGVDQLVDSVRAEFGVDKVFLVGHSRGTMVSSSYLGNAARAAKVAKYVAVDGAGCGAGGIDCVAPTQALFPPQSHVEVCTSAESFAMQYEFFMGEPPQVVDIVRQKGMATISGKAMNFPANTGRAGVTLEIYEVDPATGARLSDTPQDTFPIGPEGDWGPATVNPDKMYELALVDPGGRIHHFYPQRFLRDTHLVRLLSGPSDSPTRLNTNSGPNHAAIIVIRMREWHQQTDPDVLEISTASASGNEDPVDVIPSGVGNGNIALHIHDDAATPGLSSLNPLPYFPAQAFQTGIDVYMPAADPPDGTITVRNIPRGDTSKPQVINVPNWASSGHSITVVFADYAQPVQ